jgi:hypothetical protein
MQKERIHNLFMSFYNIVNYEKIIINKIKTVINKIKNSK